MSGDVDLGEDPRSAFGENTTPFADPQGAENGWGDFSPWHKPRKQWVREEQWLAQLKLLLDARVPGQHGDDVSYAGLPGREFLDLRIFADECGRRDLRFRYLGFGVPSGGKDGVIARVSQQQLGGRQAVAAERCVSRLDRFELIGREKSKLRKTVSDQAPFDVVNLDLCTSAASDPPMTGSFYDALRTLLELQHQHQGRPWLLLLTTRAERGLVDDEAGRRLAEGLRINCADSNFAAALRSTLGEGPAEKCLVAEGWSDIDAHDFTRVFVAGISKWLIRLLAAFAPPRVVELRSLACYRVKGIDDAPDMASLVFRIVPQGSSIRDPAGLAGTTSAESANEAAIATRMLGRLGSMKDIDGVLRDGVRYAQFLEKAAFAIQEAGGDSEKYRQWAQQV